MALARRVALPALRVDRARERAVQTRLILAAERALEVRLAQALAAAGRRAAAAHRDGRSAAAALESLPAELARILRASLADIARQMGRRVVQAPKSAQSLPMEAKAFGDLDRAIADHMARDAGRRVVGISESLRDTIARTVERGIAEGLGQDELARRIVEATSGEIGMARARRIARTEVHNAAMYGQQAAAEDSPLAFEKVWLATEDHRTRASHAKANGQRVALDERFELQTETGATVRLLYPGDLSGPPGETINCRCVVAYEPLPEMKPQGGDRQPSRDVPDFDVEIFEPDRPLPEALPDVLVDIAPSPTPTPAPRLYPRAPARTEPDLEPITIDLPAPATPEAAPASPDFGVVIEPGPYRDVDPGSPDFQVPIDPAPAPAPIAVEAPAAPVDLAPPPEPEAPAPLPDRLLADRAARRVEDALAVIMDRDGPGPNAIAADLAVELALDAATAPPGSATVARIRDAADELQATMWSRLRLRDFLDELLADLTETP